MIQSRRPTLRAWRTGARLPKSPGLPPPRRNASATVGDCRGRRSLQTSIRGRAVPCLIRRSRAGTPKPSPHSKTPTPKRLTATQPATATAPAPEQQNQSLRTGSRTNPIHHSPCAQSLGINLQSNSSQSVEYSAHDEGNASSRLSATPTREGKCPRQP
mgnify:CR=1 FL=1